MARSRNIKPGFFTNEDLVDLPFECRLLFIGLWTLADREGRLEDRPKRIKMAVFPADDVNVDACLNLLQGKKFILRYQHGDSHYIQVLAFKKHQTPHIKEAGSIIPAPIEHRTSIGQASDKPNASPSDSFNLIPDSLNPVTDSQIPETLIPDSRERKRASAPHAHRLPPNLELPAEWIADAKKIKPDWPHDKPAQVFEAFRDYWSAKSGKDATKTDWRATWRNWCRRESGFARGGAGPPKLFEQQRREAMDKVFDEFMGESEAIEGEVQHG